MEISDIIRSFESSTKNKKQRYKEFCAHCWYVYDKQIKSTKSKKMINKYNIMRKNTLEYIVANEKAIVSELSKRK
jgi:hypothetical protein